MRGLHYHAKMTNSCKFAVYIQRTLQTHFPMSGQSPTEMRCLVNVLASIEYINQTRHSRWWWPIYHPHDVMCNSSVIWQGTTICIQGIWTIRISSFDDRFIYLVLQRSLELAEDIHVSWNVVIIGANIALWSIQHKVNTPREQVQ